MFSLQFLKPASPEEWTSFTLAITDAYWKLPFEARPKGTKQASDLFSGNVLSLFPHGGTCIANALTLATGVIMTPGTCYRDTAARTLKLTDKREAFFARITLVLLHHFCPEYADIRISDDSEGCEIAVLWIRKHLGLTDLSVSGMDRQIMHDGSLTVHINEYCNQTDGELVEYHWKVLSHIDGILAHRRWAEQQLKAVLSLNSPKPYVEYVQLTEFRELTRKMKNFVGAALTSCKEQNDYRFWFAEAMQLLNRMFFISCPEADMHERNAFITARSQLNIRVHNVSPDGALRITH
ncbi:TPA: hypothetical protein PFE07_004089 [Kluyvera cryocrescens]|nr:hypothetical protein [Kluyvera cryocrescens]